MIRIVLFWAFFPFVFFQALRTRKSAPKVSGASGPNRGSSGRGNPFNLVAIGDSIISGVGASNLTNALVGQTAQHLSQALRCRVDWAAYGSIGAGSGKVLRKLLPKLPAKEADFIVLSVGVNDITAMSNTSTWRRNLEAILSVLRRHSPNAIVAVAGIPPLRGFPLLPQPLRALFGMRGKTFDIICRRVISRYPMAVHVPLEFDPQPDKFSADGFHPSEKSYQEFGRITANQIAKKYKSIAVGKA